MLWSLKFDPFQDHFELGAIDEDSDSSEIEQETGGIGVGDEDEEEGVGGGSSVEVVEVVGDDSKSRFERDDHVDLYTVRQERDRAWEAAKSQRRYTVTPHRKEGKPERGFSPQAGEEVR